MRYQAQRLIGFGHYGQDYRWESHEENPPSDYRVKIHCAGPLRDTPEEAFEDIKRFPAGKVDLRKWVFKNGMPGYRCRIGTGDHQPKDVVVVI